MADTLRAFVAVKPPDAVRRHIEVLQSTLRSKGLKLRWVRPQNIHLTLKFLGDIPVAQVADVAAAMQRVAGEQPPLMLTHQGIGVFPGIRRPRVLWTGLGGNLERLQRLVKQLEIELEALGFKREKRPFKAHLTLARVKAKLNPERLLQALQGVGDYEPLAFDVAQMVLYQSELHPQGARYTTLAHTDLG